MAYKHMWPVVITPGIFPVNRSVVLEVERQSFIANAYDGFDLGGDLNVGITGTGVQDIASPRRVKLDATQEVISGGVVFKAIIEARVENAALSMTPEIWEYSTLTAPTLLLAGSAITSITLVRQVFVITSHPAADRYYGLRINKSSGTYKGYIVGRIERSAP